MIYTILCQHSFHIDRILQIKSNVNLVCQAVARVGSGSKMSAAQLMKEAPGAALSSADGKPYTRQQDVWTMTGTINIFPYHVLDYSIKNVTTVWVHLNLERMYRQLYESATFYCWQKRLLLSVRNKLLYGNLRVPSQARDATSAWEENTAGCLQEPELQ